MFSPRLKVFLLLARKKIVFSSIVVLVLNLSIGSGFATADTSNPPKILGIVSEFDSSKSYKAGDVISFQVTFSSDSYGLKNLAVEFGSSECIRWNIRLGPGGAKGNFFKGVSDDPDLRTSGYLGNDSFRFFGQLKSSCFQGTNDLEVRVAISDFSNLTTSFSHNFSVVVANGLAKRPGETRGPDQSIEIIDYSRLFVGKKLEGSTIEIALPLFTKEGVSLLWGKRGGSICQIRSKSSPEAFTQVITIRNTNSSHPSCELWFNTDSSTLDLYSDATGDLSFYLFNGELVTALKYERMKSVSQRKTAITCVKGKLSKKVIAVNPKCPIGYKRK